MARPNSWSGFDGRAGGYEWQTGGGGAAEMLARTTRSSAMDKAQSYKSAANDVKWGLNTITGQMGKNISDTATVGNFGLGIQEQQYMNTAQNWAAEQQLKATKKAQPSGLEKGLGLVAGIAKSVVPFLG